MRRRRTAAAVAAAATGVAVVLAPAAAASPTTIAYVAGTFADTGLDYFPRQAGASTMGYVEFTPTRRTISLTIDDVAALDGQTVPVRGLPGVAPGRITCLPVGTPVRLRGFSPGVRTSLQVQGDLTWWGVYPDAGCTGHAVAGVVELNL